MAKLRDSVNILLQDSEAEQLLDSLGVENPIISSIGLTGQSQENIVLSGEAKVTIQLSGNVSKHEE